MDGAEAERLGSLGSLADSARKKQLKTARGILYFVGFMTLGISIIFALRAESTVNKEIDNELREARAQGYEVDEAEVDEIRTAAVRSTVLANLIGAGIGALFVAFAIYVYRKPVPITIASLVVYIGSNAVYGFLDPTALVRGLLIKIIIIVALFKAVQAAIASQREQDLAALGPLAPAPNPA